MGASRSASGRADERGGEADKLGHTDVAFLGKAVKTLGECGWVAARAHNWGRAAATFPRFRRPPAQDGSSWEVMTSPSRLHHAASDPITGHPTPGARRSVFEIRLLSFWSSFEVQVDPSWRARSARYGPPAGRVALLSHQ